MTRTTIKDHGTRSAGVLSHPAGQVARIQENWVRRIPAQNESSHLHWIRLLRTRKASRTSMRLFLSERKKALPSRSMVLRRHPSPRLLLRKLHSQASRKRQNLTVYLHNLPSRRMLGASPLHLLKSASCRCSQARCLTKTVKKKVSP